MSRAQASVLLVGIGGLGTPAAIVLARAGVGRIGICDDDEVEETNLHRQILFRDADVGRPKLEAAKDALLELAPGAIIETHATRLLPHNATELVRAYDLVVEGSDNFATKFLTADACRIAGRPVVHGAAVRWHGTALAVLAGGQPCYRCVFEDLPTGDAPNCDEAGVMGPVVGLVGALQADLALALLDGKDVGGTLVTVERERVRRRRVRGRAGCALCGPQRNIASIERARYLATNV
ncbi:MAG: Sulfur carrier protein adenylyltransferase ThiF [Myxococcaceae bacterium]|nr:Sulfur carrier protein adenylyltransferase ThiF [Myxococcaceae bacterium]